MLPQSTFITDMLEERRQSQRLIYQSYCFTYVHSTEVYRDRKHSSGYPELGGQKGEWRGFLQRIMKYITLTFWCCLHNSANILNILC